MRKQMKLTRTAAAGLACALVLTSTPVEVSAAKAPAWKATVSKLTVGNSKKFTVKNMPKKGKVVFSSSKSSVASVNKKTGVVKAKKAGKTVIKAVVKNKKNKTVRTLKKTVTIVKKTSQSVKKGIVIDTVYTINSKDFTVAVKATKNGKDLSSFVKADIEKEVASSSLTLKGTNYTAKANYLSFSADTGLITYRLDDSSIKLLKPHDNGEAVGSADGSYQVTASGISTTGTLKTYYVEELYGNSISGYVYDQDTHLPIAGAQVASVVGDENAKKVVTDATGYYYLTSTAGVATVKAQTTGADKDLYFLTTKKEVSVNNNNKTACNMYLDTYNEQELFINGMVKSKATSAKESEKVEGATVALYEIDKNGKETKIKSVKTDSTGSFIFANSKAYATGAYKEVTKKYGIADGNSGKIVTFAYDKGIKKENSYKIVISKALSTSNITDVYETKTTANYQFTNNRSWNLDETGENVITPIAQTNQIDLNVNWDSANILPTASSTELTVRFCYAKANGTYSTLKSGKIKVDLDADTKSMKKAYNLAAEKFFDANGKYPTLPTGTYFVIVDDGQSDATKSLNKDKLVSALVVSNKIDLTAGSACTIPTVTIKEAKSTTVNVNCSVAKDAALAKQKSASPVQVVSDNKGTILESVKVPIEFMYYAIDPATNSKIYIKKDSKELTYLNVNGAKAVSCTTAITRTVAGTSYFVDPTPSYVTADELTFTQSSDSASTESIKNCKGAANLYTVNISDLSRFKVDDGEEAVTAAKTMKITKVSLYNASTNQLVGSYEGTDKITAFELVATGYKIPDAATELKGIAPGSYYVTIDVDGFKTAKSDKFDVIDFERVKATVDTNVEFMTKTSIAGTILTKSEGMDIQDNDVKTIDAMLLLYDKDGKIVGATTYGNKTYSDGKLKSKYAFIDGENAYIEDGEKYTVVLRTSHNPNQTAFETVATEVTVKKNEKVDLPFTVSVGAKAGLTITASDENDNVLKNANIVMFDSYFKKYHITNPNAMSSFIAVSDMIDDSLVSEEIESEVFKAIAADANLVGAFKVPATEVAKEWKAIKCLPGGVYSAYIYADGCQMLEINDFKIANETHVEKKDNHLKLIAGADTVQLTVEYTHQRAVDEAVPFDMIEVMNADGSIVAREYITDTKNNVKSGVFEIKSAVLYVPNKAGTYTVRIYSNESFIGSQDVVIQGVAATTKISLNPSVTG